ncbi:MAG: ZIP family metal transporter [Defluviitaleaceae bacterium]|nr:ZIP family metal transporter [Defluviitaleaceae bacterium]
MNIILMSLFAGVIGMGVGGLLTTLFGNRTDKMISIFLSFAGGVMISIVFLELIPEAVEYSSIWVTVIGLVIGSLMVLVLNSMMDKISDTGKEKPKLHETYAEFFHASEIISSRKSMLRSGIILLFAIALHNIPEGLAMGAAGYHDAALGLTLAIIIGLHNIPEGMAISAPLISGGLSKIKAVTLTLMAGSTTVLGAIAGVIIGGISDLALALSFSIAGGAMLYVVLAEILPQSIVTNKDRVPTIFALVGIIIGMLLTAI